MAKEKSGFYIRSSLDQLKKPKIAKIAKQYIDFDRKFIFKYRIYPSRRQKRYIKRIAGLYRLYWNFCIAKRKEDPHWKLPTYLQLFQEYKPEAVEWCHELDSAALASAPSNLFAAYGRYYALKKLGFKNVREPFFKRKRNNRVFVAWQQTVPKLAPDKDELLITQKLGPIKIKLHRLPLLRRIRPDGDDRDGKGMFEEVPTRIGFKSVAIKEEVDGKWYALLEHSGYNRRFTNLQVVGIDWNCRDDSFLVLSTGEKIACPRFLLRQKKHIQDIQKRLSRKYVPGLKKQSKNYYKELKKLQKVYAKVGRQRRDWLHKLTTSLSKRFDCFLLEDIDMEVMKERGFAEVIRDQGYSMLRDMLAQKSDVVMINPAYTSKTCSKCGYINMNVTLKVHEWDCPKCGAHHDRDINAAINIRNKYLGIGPAEDKCLRK